MFSKGLGDGKGSFAHTNEDASVRMSMTGPECRSDSFWVGRRVVSGVLVTGCRQYFWVRPLGHALLGAGCGHFFRTTSDIQEGQMA